MKDEKKEKINKDDEDLNSVERKILLEKKILEDNKESDLDSAVCHPDFTGGCIDFPEGEV